MRIAMTKTARGRLLLAGVALVLGATPFVVFAQAEGPPPAPEWVDPETGIGNFDEMPDRIPVAGEEGNVVGYVRKQDLFGPDGGPPGEGPDVNGAQRETAPQVLDENGHPIGRLDHENGFVPND